MYQSYFGLTEAPFSTDQQRRRGATPTLLTALESAAEPKPFAYLICGLIAAVLVGAGMVIGWLRPWQSEQPRPAGKIIPRARAARAHSVGMT